MLEVNTKAPDFSLQDQDGNTVSLSDLAGTTTVLYFYPKDQTPGCIKEACSFRDNFKAYTDKGIRVIGISPDGAKSHQNFISKQSLPFTLLSDPDHSMMDAYHAWGEKKMYGKTYEGVLRITYVINEEGSIILAYPKVKTTDHAETVLKDLGL